MSIHLNPWIKKHCHRLLIVITMGFTILITDPLTYTSWAGSSFSLERKMAEITLINNQLTSQKLNAILLREKLYEEKKTLVDEIMGERSKSRINTYPSAKKNPRIQYNLLLIREILGYITIFNEKIRHYQIGNDKFSYLLQQAEDEVMIAKTINEMKVEALNSQIELVMEQYMPEAHTIVLNPDDMVYLTPELIWNKLLEGSL